jgi:SHS2 domain-containing protein
MTPITGFRRSMLSTRYVVELQAAARYIVAMDPSFELFDHTADMGLRIRAATLSGLLEPAARALYASIGTLQAAGDGSPRAIELSGGEPAELLRDFVTELLVVFEHEGRIATRIDSPVLEDALLSASCLLEDVDGPRSEFAREVKAVTYHELAIREIDGGYEATMIVDI